MLFDPDRLQAAIAAAAGGVFYGLFHLSTTLMAGATPAGADVVRAMLNVVTGILAGILVAYCLAPSIAQMIPWPSMRDLHSVGFVIGALAWELAPFAYRIARARAAKAEKEPS